MARAPHIAPVLPTQAGAARPQHGRNLWVDTLQRLLRHPSGMIGLGLVTVIVVGALGAPWFSAVGPLEQARGVELSGASAAHPLGTDEFGRDILSRVLYGARISLGIGVVAVASGAAVGILLGVIAGFRGGRTDQVLMRLLEVLLAFPPILLGIAITAILGPGITSIGLAVIIASIPDFARIARAATISERAREYVLAARALGVPEGRIMARHVVPNIVPPLLVQLSVAMSFAVLIEAGLSFLGVGVQDPQPSWGSMLQTARTYLYQAPSYALFVGAALAVLLTGLNFVADALRDVLDPRMRRELR